MAPKSKAKSDLIVSYKSVPRNSVWSSMDYVPPRGPCNHKASLMSSTCSCLRFMLHPVKAATSFNCDGCGHHASFHLLENPVETEILAKWDRVATESRQATLATRPLEDSRKRRRITSAAEGGESDFDVEVIDHTASDRSLRNAFHQHR